MFHFSEKQGPPKRYFLFSLDPYLDVEKNPPYIFIGTKHLLVIIKKKN